MTTTTTQEARGPRAARAQLVRTAEDLDIALPPSDLSLDQSEEWFVVKVGDAWRQIGIHDYDEIYKVPGLYERIIYDLLKCDSPRTIRDLLVAEMNELRARPESFRVLDLGAGNGMVAEQLRDIGVPHIVGVDIIEEALRAARRDRPAVYNDYLVADMTNLSADERQRLVDHRFNTMVCVAALGFGDIPTAAFTNTLEFVEKDGWVAFNIKEDFLTNRDDSGFCELISTLIEEGRLEVLQKVRYRHRLGTDREPIYYVAIVARKR